MEFQFEADEWNGLSVADRISRCRLMANEARTFANSCPPNLKDEYLSIARQWMDLASELELPAHQHLS
jgi:hypothetical protein